MILPRYRGSIQENHKTLCGMEEQVRFPDYRKRKRRRRADRQPLSGWLQATDQLKGNTGLISDDLATELFQYHSYADAADIGSDVQYVAIAPWAQLAYSSIEETDWTIVPVRTPNTSENDTHGLQPNVIQFPATSALRSAVALQANALGKSSNTHHLGFQIGLLDVEPLSLDTICVAVDGNALDRHDEVQRKFGGGFLGSQVDTYVNSGKKPMKSKADGSTCVTPSLPHLGEQDCTLTAAIREALRSSLVARQGDLLPLPLPSHPITHAPLPPAQIILCEPVNQGLPTKSTKIVVHRSHHPRPAKPTSPIRHLHHFASSKSLTDFDTTDGDGTSHEAFHSAVESGDSSEGEIGETISESDGMDKGSGGSSYDSDDSLISMSTPSLALQVSGITSSRTAATPRVHPSRATGVSSPSSTFSNMTTTTTRQVAPSTGKLFTAKSLLQKVPDESLHPRPAPDEDEESRVFVDVRLLVRVGCFSGDWVRIEAATTSGIQKPHWPSASSDLSKHHRPVKIYGLPDLQLPSMPRSAGAMPQASRSCTSTILRPNSSPLTAWISPILLANLGQAETVRISPLLDASYERVSPKSRSGRKNVESSAMPPIAREMTLLRIATPLSTERAVQAGLFTSLKRYFEQKRRVVQRGNLIALPIDANASRLLAQPAQTSDLDEDIEELLAAPSAKHDSTMTAPEVAWFRVGDIVGLEPLEASELTPNFWSGVFLIEPKTTRMRQVGTEQSRIPPQLNSTWQNYLSLRASTVQFSSQLVRGFTASLPKPSICGIGRRLRELIAAATSPRALHIGLDPVIILLHSTQRNIGKATLAERAAFDLGVHTFNIDANDLLAEGAGSGDMKAEAFFKARVDRALSCGAAFTSILLRHVEALTADRMITAIKDIIGEVKVLIATTTELDKVPELVRSIFTHELEVLAPDEGEREGLLQEIIQSNGVRISSDVDLAAIAVKTAALVAGNLADIVERAVVAKQNRLERLISGDQTQGIPGTQVKLRDLLVSGGEYVHCVMKADFDLAVEAARKNFADAIGAPKIPHVSWNDVGGLENIRDAVMETIQLPLERPELFAKGMKKRSGILLYGPPGTGKTLLAKAIATEFSLNFFSIKGPELLNMYIGESEANVRRVFQRARDARPCVVFFDELDSVAPKRGNQGDSGGVMDRIVSQLLAELDGMSDGEEGAGGVFVIGATNRPDLLDQALVRPGRFDKMLYLGVSDTHQKQLTILEALTRKFIMHPKMSLRRVAESLPFTYTGADLYALCSDAMLKAITRQASAVEARIKALPGGPVTTAYFFDHLAKEEDVAVIVTEDDFAAAQKELVASVR